MYFAVKTMAFSHATEPFRKGTREMNCRTLSIGQTGRSLRAMVVAGVSASTLILAMPEEAAAQAADAADGGSAIEELVVTARRREERLQDVPLAVTAFTSERIDRLNLKDTSGLARFTPGLQFTDVVGGRNDRGTTRAIIMRGLNLASNSGLTAGALVFLDGAPVIGGEIGVSQDIERVEVLRGPQNVYFGRSTFSGAINYVTKPISREFSGVFSGEAGSYSTFEVNGRLDVPLIDDKLYGRVTVRSASQGGYYDNQFNPSEKLGARKTRSVAGALNFTPFEGFEAKLYGNYYENEDGVGASAVVVNGNQFNCKANPAATVNNYYCGTLPNVGGPFQIWSNTALPPTYRQFLFHPAAPSDNLNGGEFEEQFGLQRKASIVHLTMNLDLPFGITATTVSAVHHDQTQTVADNLGRDPTSVVNPLNRVFVFNGTSEFIDASHEIRFSQEPFSWLRWTAGANMIDAKQTNDNLTVTQGRTNVVPVTAVAFASFNKSETVGFFAGAYIKPLESVTISIEGRTQKDKRTVIGTARPAVKGVAEFKSTSPRVSIDYKPVPNITVYASYATGTRPGGFNTALIGQSQFVRAQILAKTGLVGDAYDEEKLTTYEVGLKGTLFGRLSGALTAYWGRLDQQQVSLGSIAYTTDAGTPLTVAVISNIGETKIHGIEAEGTFQVNDVFTLGATYAWTPTEIVTYPCVACVPFTGSQDVTGHSLNGSPERAASFAIDARDTLSGDWDWFAHADYVWREGMWVDIENLTKTDNINVVNLRAGVRNADWTLEAYVTNALDDKTLISGDRVNDNTVGTIGYKGGLPIPRMIGARARYSF